MFKRRIRSLEKKLAPLVPLVEGVPVPSLLIVFPDVQLDELELPVGPPAHNSTHATVGTGNDARELLRRPDETGEQFERRVSDELPVCGGGLAVFWPWPTDA